MVGVTGAGAVVGGRGEGVIDIRKVPQPMNITSIMMPSTSMKAQPMPRLTVVRPRPIPMPVL